MKRTYGTMISPGTSVCQRGCVSAAQLRRRLPALGALLVILAILLGSGIRALAGSQEKQGLRKYYTSIRIESGDTLWELADAYLVDGVMDRESFIREVIELNGLSSGEIHSGAYIVVPYYSAETKQELPDA